MCPTALFGERRHVHIAEELHAVLGVFPAVQRGGAHVKPGDDHHVAPVRLGDQTLIPARFLCVFVVRHDPAGEQRVASLRIDAIPPGLHARLVQSVEHRDRLVPRMGRIGQTGATLDAQGRLKISVPDNVRPVIHSTLAGDPGSGEIRAAEHGFIHRVAPSSAVEGTDCSQCGRCGQGRRGFVEHSVGRVDINIEVSAMGQHAHGTPRHDYLPPRLRSPHA